MRRLTASLGAGLLAGCVASHAVAGPPYVTEDPEPTERGRWEIYNFATATERPGATQGQGGLDINYGAADNLQLNLVLPVAYVRGERPDWGFGDVEVAAKYRFLHQAKGGLTPDLAFTPSVTLPTGGRRFGEGAVTLFVPLSAQKDVGPWSVFGGGGYAIRPGRNVWETGVVVTRSVGERLSLGGEVYHNTSEEPGEGAFTGLNVGVVYKLSDRWSLLVSGGPGIQNRSQGRCRVYASLKADY